MKSIQLVLLGLFVTLMSISAVSKAEDIDIFSGIGGAAGVPNVLIILDNTANWQTPFINEKSALVSTVASLGETVNMGLMMFVETGSPNDNVDGGYVRFGIRQMTGANKGALGAMVNALDKLNDKGNNATYGLAMQEAYLYFAGLKSRSGFGKAKRDYAGNTAYNSSAANLTGNPFTSASSDIYVSPISDECQKNFIIFISNGTANDNASATSSATTLLTGAGGDATTITLSPNGEQTNVADEWARFLSSKDVNSTKANTQTVRTYTVDVMPGTQPSDLAHTALLKSMATQGKGKYFAVTGDASAIAQALLNILNEIQATNSVFSSSSLPVSVNAQGTYLNQVYMGMFRPDPNGLPRWLGNLKQYKFKYDQTTGALTLTDSSPSALDVISTAGTGFIVPDAISFWTSKNLLTEPDLSGGFWRNVPLPNGSGAGYDSADGELVEKGGAAQVMRLANLLNIYSASPGSTNPRNLYTYCPSGSCTAQLSATGNIFDSSNALITDVKLGTGSRTVTTLTSAATVQASGALPGTSGAANSVSITGFAKSGTTVTATVSAADWAKISVGSKLKVATGLPKYDCDPCTVISMPTSTTFTYTGANGASALPTTPYTATIYANFVTLTKTAHGLTVGKTLTLSACTTYTGLNGTIVPVVEVPTTNTFTVATAAAVSGTTSDAGCKYTPNTATATSTAHGFLSGDIIAISGAAVVGYNGSWLITVTDANTFTYQYTVVAPLGASSATATSNTTRTSLTQWVRGYDNMGDELSPDTTYTTINIRPSVHGDVLHSRPTVINYGGTTGVVVYYGANDGVFRAINGNQTTSIGSIKAGGELWGFIPSDFYSKLKRLRENKPVLKLPSTPAGIDPEPKTKDYFVDGSTGVYQLLNSDGTTNTAYLYLAMRRGGQLLYALDVSTPTDPKYLWKISNADADFTELGQTWSQPKVAKVKGYANPVLIFGAGYDTAEDSEPPTAVSPLKVDTMGRGIFIVDAITGAMVWRAKYGAASACSGNATKASCTVSGMDYSIPADITLVDRDNDGKVDRLYATDTGGNVWRVDLQPTVCITTSGTTSCTTYTTPDHWQVNKVAALGCDTGACAIGTTPRKFFYPADVVPTSSYDAILVGSGDREHPLYYSGSDTNKAYKITNRFYMLKDTNTGDNGSGLTTITQSGLFNAGSTNAGILDSNNDQIPSTQNTYVDSSSTNGYYIDLGTGEKVVNAPTTVAGNTYFGTNQPKIPAANSCDSSLGIARGYSIKPLSGIYTSAVFDGGGLPPSPVAGLVNITLEDGTTKQVPFLIGGPGISPIKPTNPPINVKTSRHRAYWYKN